MRALRLDLPDEPCKAVKDDGERCAVDFGINPENGLCFAHDPERRRRATRARREGGITTGGMNRARYTRTVRHDEAPPPPQTVEDIVAWSSWLAFATAVGDIDKLTAKEINGSLKVLLASLKRVGR